MNPATRKNPLDSAKYREQYLSNLRLQASNNQRNQNANLIFKNTGETPSRPPDMRTTTERAGDLEGAKVDLRSKLGTITDGVIASQIIGELDPEQIQFAIANWPTISTDMAKMFATGVPSSAFIAYLNRLIQKFQLTDGVETGLQQSTGNAIIMSNTQLLNGLPREQVFGILDNTLDRIGNSFGINMSAIKDRINEVRSLIPTQRELQIFNELPTELQADIMTIANQLYNNIPSNQELTDTIGELNIGLANRDRKYTIGGLDRLTNLVAIDQSVLTQREEMRDIINDFINSKRAKAITEGGLGEEESGFADFDADELPDANVNPLSPSKPTLEEIVKGSAPPRRRIAIEEEEEESAPTEVPRKISRMSWDALKKQTRANKQVKVDFLNARLRLNSALVLRDNKDRQYGSTIRGGKFFSVLTTTTKGLNAAYEDYMAQSDEGMVGDGLVGKSGKMSGKGLRPKIEKPYRQSIAHLVDKPIEKPKPYTPFGRYYINKHRLEGEGIIAFRQPSGNTINTLPTEKVSKNFSKVMRTLVGNGIPSYEEIGELTKAEQNKLHHICKVCQINNPAIPKLKGAGEQEDDRFEILRGEIIAGNDNAKIAKEFKVMLMKFMNEGRIPRRQANEILQELLALGH